MEQVVVVEEADPVRPSSRDARVAGGRDPGALDGLELQRSVGQDGPGGIVEPIRDHDELVKRARLPQSAVHRLLDQAGVAGASGSPARTSAGPTVRDPPARESSYPGAAHDLTASTHGAGRSGHLRYWCESH